MPFVYFIDYISLFFIIIFIFSIFFVFVSLFSLWVSHSNWWQLAEMYAERIECDVQWAYIHTNTLERRKNISENWLCSHVTASLSPSLSGPISYPSLCTPTNEWIIEFVYVQYQVTMKRQANTKKNWRVFVSQFSHHFHSSLFYVCLCYFLLFVLFTEKWVMCSCSIFLQLNAANKREKCAKTKTYMHARTHTVEAKK